MTRDARGRIEQRLSARGGGGMRLPRVFDTEVAVLPLDALVDERCDLDRDLKARVVVEGELEDRAITLHAPRLGRECEQRGPLTAVSAAVAEPRLRAAGRLGGEHLARRVTREFPHDEDVRVV